MSKQSVPLDTLVFEDADRLTAILDFTEAAELADVRPTYAQQVGGDLRQWDSSWRGKRERGLWVVKDRGVYLMSNAPQPDPKSGGKRMLVCYAEGLNPDSGDADDVWSRAHALSGDDFVEFLPLPEKRDGAWPIRLEIDWYEDAFAGCWHYRQREKSR